MDLKKEIEKRAKEHETIMNTMEKDMNVLLEKMQKLKADKSNHQELMVTSTTLLTLKDKMMFHKACLLTLKDVLTLIP